MGPNYFVFTTYPPRVDKPSGHFTYHLPLSTWTRPPSSSSPNYDIDMNLVFKGPRPLIQGNFRNKFSRQNQGLPIIEQKKKITNFFINAFHSSKSKNKSTIRGHKNSDFCLQLKRKKR